MTISTNIESIVERYLHLFPDESDSLSRFLEFLASFKDDAARKDRTNYKGHMTASCLVVDAIKKRILLLDHPFYEMILQPGGHFSNDAESPIDAATRKLFSETPLSKRLVSYLRYDFNEFVPIDIDTHSVKPRVCIEEKVHVHYDFRYVFLAVSPEGADREINTHRETTDGKQYAYRWLDFAELKRYRTFDRLSNKLHYFLSNDSARHRFYVSLSAEQRPETNVNTILVTHLLPDSVEFIEAINHCTNLLGVIPKPKSINDSMSAALKEQGIPIINISREQVTDTVSQLVASCEPQSTVLLDIGGWFSHLLETRNNDVCKKILGVVEDTKNGQDKYEAIAAHDVLPFPVITLAESNLKDNEDYLVGQSIVFSADAVLRQCGLVLEYLDCGVIGFGKIGNSIARHLQQRGIKPKVVEKDTLRRLKAYREQCTIVNRGTANSSVDVLFCATGSQATDIIDFRSLRHGTFIFSVTSADDEFDKGYFNGEYDISQHPSCDIVERCDGEQNFFYLVNNGNAVNFLHGAVLWEFIQLVKGGLFLAMKQLADGIKMPTLITASEKSGPGYSNMLELSREQQIEIANLWTETVYLGVRLND